MFLEQFVVLPDSFRKTMYFMSGKGHYRCGSFHEVPASQSIGWWNADGGCLCSYVRFVVKLNIFSHIKAVCGHKTGVDM